MKQFTKFPITASSKMTKSYEYNGFTIYQGEYGFAVYKNGKKTSPEFTTSEECEEYIDGEFLDDVESCTYSPELVNEVSQ